MNVDDQMRERMLGHVVQAARRKLHRMWSEEERRRYGEFFRKLPENVEAALDLAKIDLQELYLNMTDQTRRPPLGKTPDEILANFDLDMRYEHHSINTLAKRLQGIAVHWYRDFKKGFGGGGQVNTPGSGQTRKDGSRRDNRSHR